MDARATRNESEAQCAAQAIAVVPGTAGTQDSADNDTPSPPRTQGSDNGAQGGDNSAPSPSGVEGSDDCTASPLRVWATGRGPPNPPLLPYCY